jgi:hypothetical protein
MTEQKRSSLLEIVRDYEDLAERALQRLAGKQPPKNDWPMTDQHRIERSPSGGFIAFWQNQAIYEKGRMRKVPTEKDARAFLVRCDAAGKIIHENWSAWLSGVSNPAWMNRKAYLPVGQMGLARASRLRDCNPLRLALRKMDG